jgi:hypothetical protein
VRRVLKLFSENMIFGVAKMRDAPMIQMSSRHSDNDNSKHHNIMSIPTIPTIPTITCKRCKGSGSLRHMAHVEGGVCFGCNGCGKVRTMEASLAAAIQGRAGAMEEAIIFGKKAVEFKAARQQKAIDGAHKFYDEERCEQRIVELRGRFHKARVSKLRLEELRDSGDRITKKAMRAIEPLCV